MLKSQSLDTSCCIKLVVVKKGKGNQICWDIQIQKNHQKKQIKNYKKVELTSLPAVCQGANKHGSKKESVQEYAMSSKWREKKQIAIAICSCRGVAVRMNI